jgi:Kelch motif
MTDREFERRLRAWYHADAPQTEVAPMALRQRVLAIPTSVGRDSRSRDRARLLLLAAALLVGGAVAAGTGIVHLPQRELSPTPLPSEEARVSPVPSGPPPSPLPQQPQVPPTGPLTRDVLAATQGFRLFPGGTGWAATASAIYRTSDAGDTWTNERPAGWTASAASALVDADTAYLASDSLPMVMAVTHSGGASWSTATIDDSRIGGSPTFSFQTPMRGYATFPEKDSDTKLRVYTTDDGGHTWSGPKLSRIPQIHWNLGKIEGPSGGVLYMVPGKADNQPFDNHLVLSMDGGVTWKTRSFPIGESSPKAVQKWVSRIWLDADGMIRIAIQADDRYSMWSSHDDGRTWRLERILPRYINVSENDFLSATEWIFARDDGSSGFRSTTDAGAHWRTTNTIDDTRIDPSTLSFASVDVGWALEQCYFHGGSAGGYCDGERPVLVSTKDGGRTWTPVGQAKPASPPPTPVPGAAAWVSAGMSVTHSDAARGPGVTALALADGRVLAIGGGHADSSAALYDPTSDRWTATAPMVHDRMGEAAVLLADGRVFVIGGSYDNGDHATTEFYDPTAGRWSRGPSMAHRKQTLQAARFRDGRVLVVGAEPGGTFGAEVYDPATGRWTPTGAPLAFRFASAPLVVLRDGRVLMAGGDDDHNRRLASAELYDPATGTWSATRRMIEPRDWSTATLLLDGRVLVVGGARSLAGRSLPSAELFDPATERWTAVAATSVAHDEASLSLLADGRVLVVGGDVGAFTPISTVEIYDPAANAWSLTASLGDARYGHAAVSLADGSVLVVGGHSTGSFHYLGSAERYYPNGPPAS